MAYGFSSLNTDGLIQIDDNFSNLSVIESGSWVQASYSTWSIQIDENSLYFLRASSVGHYVSAYTSLGNNGLFYLNVHLTIPNSGGDGIVEYIRCKPSFRVLTTPPSTGYGLNVMRADGNLAFSSELVTPQITNVISLNSSGLDLNGDVSYTYTLNPVLANKKRYFGANSLTTIGVLVWSPDFGETMYDSGVMLSAASINSSQISVKCCTDYIWGPVYLSDRRDMLNQLLIVEF